MLLMKNLTDIIKKSNKQIFYAFSYLYLGAFSYYWGTDFFHNINKINSYVESNENYYKTRKASESLFSKLDGKIEVYNKKTNEIVLEYDFGFGGGILPWISVFMGIFYMKSVFDEKSNPLREYRTKKDNTIRTMTTTLTSFSTYCIVNHLGEGLDYNDQTIFATNIAFLTSALTSDIFNKIYSEKTINKAREINNKQSLPYMYSMFRENLSEAKKYLSKGNTGQTIKSLLEVVKISRNLKDDDRLLLSDNFSNSWELEREVFARTITYWSEDYKKHLDLLIKDMVFMSPWIKHDIRNAIKRCPEEALEFRILGAEFAFDQEESKREWAEIYKLSIEKGQVKQISLKTKNIVAILNSKVLKHHYILKQEEREELETEVAQTLVLNKEAFSKMSNVLPVDVTVALYYPYIRNQEIGIGIFRYIESKHLSKVLEESPKDKQLSLLERAVEINAATAYYGINKNKIDRIQKTEDEILNLDINTTLEDKLLENYNILFKFADKFQSVYDCDGHSDNRLITGEDNDIFVTIDNEARPQNDPVYMLVKLLEYKSVLSYTKEGIDARNQLIALHFKKIDQTQPDEVQEAHYYESVPLKFISYKLMSDSGKGMNDVLDTYKASAVFALDTLIDRYNHMYSTKEIAKLTELRSIFAKI